MNISNPSAMVDSIIFIKLGESKMSKKKKEWSDDVLSEGDFAQLEELKEHVEEVSDANI